MTARRSKLLAISSLLFALVSLSGFAQEAINVSEGRAWGVGMQVGLPYGGLISVRSWLSPGLGLEGILFFSGGIYDMEGTLSARALYRASDATTTDFYIAAGATLPLEEQTLTVSVVGGIEFGFRLAPVLAWNIEFGASYALDGEFNMAIGTGVHYYFPAY
ncbi:hypothetical protein ACFLSZ_06285 [Candidatus Bipolaricaulota bacterium]